MYGIRIRLCSSLSHHRSVDICVHTAMTMKRWCDSTMKWQCNDDGAMARWKKVRCCGVAIAITRWSDSDYTEGDIEEMILYHIIVSFHCAIVIAPSLYWLSLKWIKIPAAIAQHGVWWLSNASVFSSPNAMLCNGCWEKLMMTW